MHQAKKLWIEWNARNSRPRDPHDPHVAQSVHNLGMVAVRDSRYDQAEELLHDALALQRQAAHGDRHEEVERLLDVERLRLEVPEVLREQRALDARVEG